MAWKSARWIFWARIDFLHHSGLASGSAFRNAGEEKGVRCNVIAPGFMDRPMGRDACRRRRDRAVTVPFGRRGTGREAAHAALVLISNESSYVNAHTLFLDAGHMAGIVRGSRQIRMARGIATQHGNAHLSATRPLSGTKK
jgi:hypothetical protein